MVICRVEKCINGRNLGKLTFALDLIRSATICYVLQALETLPSSSARFNNPTLCLMIFSLVFNMRVTSYGYDLKFCTSIKTGNPHFCKWSVRLSRDFYTWCNPPKTDSSTSACLLSQTVLQQTHGHARSPAFHEGWWRTQPAFRTRWCAP